jgi:hypothetical protein
MFLLQTAWECCCVFLLKHCKWDVLYRACRNVNCPILMHLRRGACCVPLRCQLYFLHWQKVDTCWASYGSGQCLAFHHPNLTSGVSPVFWGFTSQKSDQFVWALFLRRLALVSKAALQPLISLPYPGFHSLGKMARIIPGLLLESIFKEMRWEFAVPAAQTKSLWQIINYNTD